jgi:hypothetical protein
MSTPHDATYFPVESTSPYGPPALTEAAESAKLAALRVELNREKMSTYSQYRGLTGVPDPIVAQPDNGEPQGIPVVPTSSWTKADITAWLVENGVTIGEPALSNLNKSELLELVEDVLSPDTDE